MVCLFLSDHARKGENSIDEGESVSGKAEEKTDSDVSWMYRDEERSDLYSGNP